MASWRRMPNVQITLGVGNTVGTSLSASARAQLRSLATILWLSAQEQEALDGLLALNQWRVGPALESSTLLDPRRSQPRALPHPVIPPTPSRSAANSCTGSLPQILLGTKKPS